MTVRFLLFAALLLTVNACNKTDDDSGQTSPNDAPRCIQKKIRTLEKQAVHNPPASVTRYPYNNGFVYYIPSDCCDQFSELYDEDCNLICAPDGGFTGGGDGRCPTDLKFNAADAVVIWQDPR